MAVVVSLNLRALTLAAGSLRWTDAEALKQAAGRELDGGRHRAQSTSDEPEPDPDEGKNPAAVAWTLGGKKGGKARAAKLTPEQRSEIASAGTMRLATARPSAPGSTSKSSRACLTPTG